MGGDAAYAARIEQVEGGIKHLGVFAEERPALLEEGLEDAEIEHRRIRLHLAKVGIEGAVEADVGGQSVANVRAEVAEKIASLWVEGGLGRENRTAN